VTFPRAAHASPVLHSVGNTPSDRIILVMLKRIFVAVLLGIVALVLLRHAGSFLVINQPEKADLIVVMGGGNNDLRYRNGLRLMDEDWGPQIMLNVFSKGVTFGNKDIDLAREFVNRTAPGRATICPLQQSSTYDEARYLADCLRGTNVSSILVVTSTYHTRRTLSILHKRLPQYHFSIYAASDPYFFGEKWWQTREWAKTTLAEWQRYIWWQLVDRWRSGLVVN
jgi:uncharacterized SAM-binding protein YcdF (DUF218 family)